MKKDERENKTEGFGMVLALGKVNEERENKPTLAKGNHEESERARQSHSQRQHEP